MDAALSEPWRDGANRVQGLLATGPTRLASIVELGWAAHRAGRTSEIIGAALELLMTELDVDGSALWGVTPAGAFELMAGQGGQGGADQEQADRYSTTLFAFALQTPGNVRYGSKSEHGADQPRPGVSRTMCVAVPGRGHPAMVLSVTCNRLTGFTDNDAILLLSVASILGWVVKSTRDHAEIEAQARRQEQRLRYQTALADCAQNLLANAGAERLDHAVEALQVATQATYVFVERNVVDPERGLCSHTVADVVAPRAATDSPSDYWDLVPWERMPTSRSHLERGENFVVRPDQLDGAEAELYADDPLGVLSELNSPIFVGGEWAGLIGLADCETPREWTDDDIALLSTAAAMIGAYWEREKAHEHLAQLLRSKDEFLASISHEIRTPLTAVVGFAQVLRDAAHTLSPEERAELQETVVSQGTDLTNIVNDLLVAARADIGRLDVSQVPVNLRAQAAQVLEAFDRADLAKIRLGSGTARGVGDPDRVRQIIRNLLSNALRYGGDNVNVSAYAVRSTARVCVADDGTPISPNDQERIFLPYQRAHDARGVAGSLGLGLAISRQLAHLMGGDLKYCYEDGWSRFVLSLPEAD